jgi:hypothetical protein
MDRHEFVRSVRALCIYYTYELVRSVYTIYYACLFRHEFVRSVYTIHTMYTLWINWMYCTCGLMLL